MNLSGAISRRNRQDINGFIKRMAFENARWPAFKHAWYVLNDSTEQEPEYFAITE